MLEANLPQLLPAPIGTSWSPLKGSLPFVGVLEKYWDCCPSILIDMGGMVTVPQPLGQQSPV